MKLAPGQTKDPAAMVLTLKPLPDAIPAAVRVRRLLKLALWSFRLKCTRIGSESTEPPGSTAYGCDTDTRAALADALDQLKTS